MSKEEKTKSKGLNPALEAEKSINTSSPRGWSRREFVATSMKASAAALLAAGCPATGAKTPRPNDGPGPDVSSSWPPDAFGVSRKTARKVFARAMKGGASFCDLFFERCRSTSLGLQDSAVKSGHTSVDRGVGIRVVKEGETGFAFTESLDEGSMLKAAELASAIASGNPEAPPAAFVTKETKHYYPVHGVLNDVNPSAKVSLLMRLDKKIRAADGRIKKVMIHYRDQESHRVVVRSDGLIYQDRQPLVECYVMCVAEQKGRRETNGYSVAGRAGLELYDDATVDQMVKKAVSRTVLLFDAVPGPVGEMPVVLAPGSSGILLHEAIGHGMEADFAKRKTTIYTDKIGTKVSAPFVSIVDDGTNLGLQGTINFDDEGSPSQKTTLVEKGVFKSFLHNRITAAHFNMESTGNGRRQSFRHLPVPRMRNTYMLPGPHDPKEVIASVKKGIYAESFTNGQVNIGPGDFSFYLKNGRLIEDGKLGRPIKDINLIGNGPKALALVEMVGDDLEMFRGGGRCGKRGQRVPVGMGLPTVKVKSLTVGGAKNAKK